MKQLGFLQKIGTGIIRILKSYSKQSFDFFPNFIRVSFPFTSLMNQRKWSLKIKLIYLLSYNNSSKTYPAKQGMTWKEWFFYNDLTNSDGSCSDDHCTFILFGGQFDVDANDVVSDLEGVFHSGGSAQ